MYVHGEVQLTGSNVAEGIADYRLNTQGTLLASAARTTLATSPQQTNYNAKGVIIFLNVTASSGTGGLQIRIDAIDPVSGQIINLNALPTATTANGLTSYVLYPSASSAGNQVTSGALPRSWQVRVIHVDATSYTYSVGYALIL